MPEVNDPDIPSADVIEEVILANVGAIDGEIVRKSDGRCWFPRRCENACE